MAIVTAMLVSMVVVTLGATSVALAVHNSGSSAYDRRNVQSIHAAEAGVNYFFSHLQSGGAEDFECQASQTLTTTPPASFDAVATYYDAAGNPLPCPLGGIEPDSALIRSVGQTASAPPARTMEAHVKRDVLARSAVQLNSNATVFQSVISSESSVTLNSNAHIFGDATAGTTVTLNGNSLVDGMVLSDSPSAPPSYRPFPELVFDSLAWQEAGYTIQSFSSCTDAKAFIDGISSGSNVVRINAACDLAYSSNSQIPVRGDLAIVSDGALTMNSNSEFVNEDGGEHNLFLLFGLGRAAPCNISFNSNTGIDGFNSNATLKYEPIGVPGVGTGTYDENILYIREVTSQ